MPDKSPKLHIVIPVYNEDDNVLRILQQIQVYAIHYLIDYHIYFINDHSDSVITNINLAHAGTEPDVSVFLSNGHGQQEAILCGFSKVFHIHADRRNDYVCTIDCDMQDPVDVLMRMYRTLLKYSDTYDVAIGVRNRREDSLLKRFAANIYYMLQSLILRKYIPNASNFYILKVKDIPIMDRDNLSMSLIMKRSVMNYGYNRHKRACGISKYHMVDLCHIAWMGIRWSLLHNRRECG